MSNLLLILVVLFASLFLISKLLEGRAKPMEPEQAAKLSRLLMILVFVSIVLVIGKELFK